MNATRHTARAVAFFFSVLVTFATMAGLEGLAGHGHGVQHQTLWAASNPHAAVHHA